MRRVNWEKHYYSVGNSVTVNKDNFTVRSVLIYWISNCIQQAELHFYMNLRYKTGHIVVHKKRHNFCL